MTWAIPWNLSKTVLELAIIISICGVLGWVASLIIEAEWEWVMSL